MFRLLIFLSLSVILLGCASRYDDLDILGDKIIDIDKKPMNEARAYLVDKTMRSHSGIFYGNHVSYFDNSGRRYNWFAEQENVKVSSWKLRKYNGRYDLCEIFPWVDYLPKYRGKYFCYPLGTKASAYEEVMDGDVFGLSQGKVPFVLDWSNTKIEDLKQGKGEFKRENQN